MTTDDLGLADELHEFIAAVPHEYPGHLVELFERIEAALRSYPRAVREATDEQIIAAHEWSLEWMRKHNVDGLSPFKDYPPVKQTIAGMYSAMMAALASSPVVGPSTLPRPHRAGG